MDFLKDLQLTFRVKLLEDAHAGSGLGQLGLVDDLHARDRNGRPVIRWSTIRGLLREAGEDWLLAREAAGEDSKEIEADRDALYRLFGRPINKAHENKQRGQGACLVCSLYLDDDEERPAEEFFHTWTSTSRKAHSRSPLEETLRTVEFAKAGLEFQGELRISLMRSDADIDPDRYRRIVERCLKRVTALGGRRTRGWGRIEISDVKWQEISLSRGANFLPGQDGAGSDGSVVLKVLLHNPEPLLFAATRRVSQLTGTLNFIPGTSLRGALLTFIQRIDPELARRLAEPQRMSVGNAYHVPEQFVQASGSKWGNFHALPAPLTVREYKSGLKPGTRVESVASPWWSRSEIGARFLGSRGEADVVAEGDLIDQKRLKTEEYLVRNGQDGPWLRTRPETIVVLRNRVATGRIDPDLRGKASPNGPSHPGYQDDALFSQEWIAEKQYFVAELFFGSKEDALAFSECCAGLLAENGPTPWLRAGRGGMPLQVVSIQRGESLSFTPRKDDRLTVTLTSDLILRAPHGAFIVRPELSDWAEWIALSLGLESMPSFDSVILDEESSVWESVSILGFNAASGLPRAPAVGIKRGSVFVFRSKGPDGLSQLQQLRQFFQRVLQSHPGLGERVEDGCGRFVLDLDVHRSECWKQWNQELADKLAVKDGVVAPHNIREEALALAEEFWERIGEKLSVSQWQWLRHKVEVVSDLKGLEDLIQQEIPEHGKRLSGRGWKAVQPILKECFSKVKQMSRPEVEKVNILRTTISDLCLRKIGEIRHTRKRSMLSGGES